MVRLSRKKCIFASWLCRNYFTYLPLLQPRYIIDSLLRIDGTFNGYESYVLKQINFCISKIPPSPAKEYADNCAKQLSRDVYMNSKHAGNLEFELEKGYDEYISKIKQLDTFFKCYRMMIETGVWAFTTKIMILKRHKQQIMIYMVRIIVHVVCDNETVKRNNTKLDDVYAYQMFCFISISII